jgi:hypothetical protein
MGKSTKSFRRKPGGGRAGYRGEPKRHDPNYSIAGEDDFTRHRFYCKVHDKWAYDSKKIAKRVVNDPRVFKKTPGIPLHPYPCDVLDGYFHVGNDRVRAARAQF